MTAVPVGIINEFIADNLHRILEADVENIHVVAIGRKPVGTQIS